MTAPRSDVVLPRLRSFVDGLRKNGVRTSPDEAADACAAILALGGEAFASRDALRAALSSTLVKSTTEEPVFHRLFDLHFGFALEGGPLLRGSLLDALVARGMDPARAQALVDELAEQGELMAALLAGDDDALTELLHAALQSTDLAGLQSPLQINYFASRLMTRLGVDDAERALAAAAGRAGGREGDAAQGAFDEALQRLRRAARRAVEVENEKNNLERMRRLRERSLEETPFFQLDHIGAARTQDLVDRLARRLKARVQRRTKRARRGRIDARRTLRANVGHDAVPVHVRFQRQRRDRPDIVVLCDVSDSVRSASLFMLQLVWALVDLFRRVRCFVFVDTLGEATALFRDARVEGAVARVLAGDVVNVSANSDYGTSLRQFRDHHMAALTQKTTVVILGDGRSNYRPPEDQVLDEVRRRARHVVWLATEERGTWGFGDSEMRRYARHVSVVEVVRNLRDLARAVDRLVL